jgi:uncharacterized protein YegP (UPF0339 family)
MGPQSTLSFTIYQFAENEYYFKLKTAAGELLLTGNPCYSRMQCENDIMSVRISAARPKAYEIRMTLSNFYQFVIRNTEAVIIGKSELFAIERDRDKVMTLVKNFAGAAAVNDMIS